MRIYYVCDFENGIDDMDLAKRLWVAYTALRKIDRTLPIEASMYATYCVLSQRCDGPDEWVRNPPGYDTTASEFLSEFNASYEHIATINPDDGIKKLIRAFEVSFNVHTPNTMIMLLRDWRNSLKKK